MVGVVGEPIALAYFNDTQVKSNRVARIVMPTVQLPHWSAVSAVPGGFVDWSVDVWYFL